MDKSPFKAVKNVFELSVIRRIYNELDEKDFKLNINEIVEILNKHINGNIEFIIPEKFTKSKCFSELIVGSNFNIDTDDEFRVKMQIYLFPTNCYNYFRKIHLERTHNKFSANKFLSVEKNKFFRDIVTIICHEIIFHAKQIKSKEEKYNCTGIRYCDILDLDEFNAFAHDAAISLYYGDDKKYIKMKKLMNNKQRKKFNKKVQMFLGQIMEVDNEENTVNR